MHIARMHARGFKRFHDLTIETPGTPRLVMMCGPNGMGKSSVIDAFRYWHAPNSGEGWITDETYHRRSGDIAVDITQLVEIDFVEPQPENPRKLLYARSAYRHEPDFQTGSISRAGELFDAPRSRRMIDPESKVSDNYQRLVSATLDDLFGGSRDAMLVAELRDLHVGQIRDAMLELFPELELQGPGDPLSGGTFYFRKAGQDAFHYKNLSGGEKAAFDLLLDLVIKTAVYDDTVFCIDEPELHMNTRLQASLLDSLLNVLSESAQLWIASHSIGMMRRAQQLYEHDSSVVAFLDFENVNFDEPVSMAPVKPNRDFWARTLKVALGDMADLVAPDRVVLCEGRPAGGANVAKAEFDARCYRRIFEAEFPRTDFLSVGNVADVHQDRVEVGRAIQTIATGTRVTRVVDRDMRSEQEIADLEASGTRVLRRRHIESYFLDDEVLTALCESVGQPEQLSALVEARNAAIATSVADRGNDTDDLKSAAGTFFVTVRQLLALTDAGSTTEAFLADTLAPLVRPGMLVYDELRADVLAA